MTYSLHWMADALRAAGLTVVETKGWKTRGYPRYGGPDMGPIKGVTLHHTADHWPGPWRERPGESASAREKRFRRWAIPSLNGLIKGFTFSGPLCHLGLGRDGTWYCIAAGRANHAGKGEWKGVTDGNGQFIGIEAVNNGTNEPWTEQMMDSYRRGVAALLTEIEAGPEWNHGHKEYAPRRKPDPNFDMNDFRAGVARILGQAVPLPLAQPVVNRRPLLEENDRGAAVKRLQRGLITLGANIKPDTHFGPKTKAAVKAFQRKHGLDDDGRVGPLTWDALDDALARHAAGLATAGNAGDSSTPSADGGLFTLLARALATLFKPK